MFKKVKSQPIKWENIFANHLSDMGIVSRIYKELLQFIHKMIHEQILKEAKDLNGHFCKEAI